VLCPSLYVSQRNKTKSDDSDESNLQTSSAAEHQAMSAAPGDRQFIIIKYLIFSHTQHNFQLARPQTTC